MGSSILYQAPGHTKSSPGRMTAVLQRVQIRPISPVQDVCHSECPSPVSTLTGYIASQFAFAPTAEFADRATGHEPPGVVACRAFCRSCRCELVCNGRFGMYLSGWIHPLRASTSLQSSRAVIFSKRKAGGSINVYGPLQLSQC